MCTCLAQGLAENITSQYLWVDNSIPAKISIVTILPSQASLQLERHEGEVTQHSCCLGLQYNRYFKKIIFFKNIYIHSSSFCSRDEMNGLSKLPHSLG